MAKAEMAGVRAVGKAAVAGRKRGTTAPSVKALEKANGYMRW
jgi:hypothetical protein